MSRVQFNLAIESKHTYTYCMKHFYVFWSYRNDTAADWGSGNIVHRSLNVTLDSNTSVMKLNQASYLFLQFTVSARLLPSCFLAFICVPTSEEMSLALQCRFREFRGSSLVPEFCYPGW